MSYSPLNYDQINSIEGRIKPSQINAFNNATFAFWERALFQRAVSVLDIDLPEDWEGPIRDLFNWCLFSIGFVPVFDHYEYGFTFNPGSLSGYDWYYRPTRAIIANPALHGSSLDLKIGEDCEILKLTPDYQGIFDIISYYAEKLSLLDNAINMSLINNKFAFAFFAKNKASAAALQKMLDLINSGSPAVVIDSRVPNDPTDKSEPWQFWDRHNLKESYLTTQQLQDFRTLINNFDSEIGIPTVGTEKKERMITDEANATKSDSQARVRVWLNTFNSSADIVNRHFGTNIKARLHEPEGSEINVNNEIDNDRSV